MQSILGQEYEAHFVEPPMEMEPDESFDLNNSMSITSKSQSLDTYNRDALERDDVLQGYHQQRRMHKPFPRRMDSGLIRSAKLPGESMDDFQTAWSPRSGSPSIPPLSRTDSAATKRSIEGTRGHARDPLEEEFPYLYIGPSTFTGPPLNDTDDPQPAAIFEEPESADPNIEDTPMTEVDDVPIVSESPGAAEFDIYENAYRHEIERIRKRSIPRRGTAPKIYLTRRVEGRDDVMRLFQEDDGFELDQRNQQPTPQTVPIGGKVAVTPSSSFSSAVGMIRTQLEEQRQQQQPQSEPQPESQPQDQSILEPTTSETNDKKSPSSPPENPRAKLRCLLGRVRGN